MSSLFCHLLRLETNAKEEHQDSVSAQIINSTNQIVFNKEIVPSTGQDDSPDEQNAYYWPSDGRGKHPHYFNLPVTPPIDQSDINRCRLVITKQQR